MKTDILMVGVGGQGTVLSSDIVCDAVILDGYDVKKSEVHGMAQRGGSVISHVRVGDKVYSPLIPEKGADIIVSFEKLEFLRYVEFVNKDTILILNTQKIYPPSVANGHEAYPEDKIDEYLKIFKNVYQLDALDAAVKAGNSKVAGMVLLGKLANVMNVNKESWEKAVAEKVPPKTIDSNIKAFNIGFSI